MKRDRACVDEAVCSHQEGQEKRTKSGTFTFTCTSIFTGVAHSKVGSAKILNPENADSLLEQIQGLSKRKTEALVAQQLPPAKVKRENIRKVAVSQALPPVERGDATPSLFDQPPSRAESASQSHQRNNFHQW